MGFLAEELKNITFSQTALDVFLPKISYKNTQILSRIVNIWPFLWKTTSGSAKFHNFQFLAFLSYFLPDSNFQLS